MTFKIVLVTSKITNVPDNYLDVVGEMIMKHHKNIVGVICIDNHNLAIYSSLLKFYLVGVRKMFATTARNIYLSVGLRKLDRLCQQVGVPLYNVKCSEVNSDSTIEMLKKLSPDLILNLRTRVIYKRPLLELPKLGCVNIHHGLLPRERGLYCDFYALKEGREKGFTIHKMEEKVDAGKILRRVIVPYQGNNYQEYLQVCAQKERESLVEFTQQVIERNSLGENRTDDEFFCGESNYHKTPSFLEVRACLKRGMVL